MHLRAKAAAFFLVTASSVMSHAGDPARSAADEPSKKSAISQQKAAESKAPAESEARLAKARSAFDEGTRLAKQALWGEALTRFTEAARLRAHPAISYNIGICERALGHYTRAHRSLRSALKGHALASRRADAAPAKQLDDSTIADIKIYLAEIEQVLAHLEVNVGLAGATIAVDGRPLETLSGSPTQKASARLASTRKPPAHMPSARLVAGTMPAGPGRKPPHTRFHLTLDPGLHVFVVTNKGYESAVVRHTVVPGSHGKLELRMKMLPASLKIASNVPQTTVLVDGIDVGNAPLILSRRAGAHRVEVKKEGFDSYAADVTLRPAERLDLLAKLRPEEVGLHERWWFWSAIGSAVAGAAVITYFATRPDPQQPPLNGGGLGWTIRIP